MDDDGDIVTFYYVANSGNDETGELQHQLEKLLDGNNDLDNGVIAFKNEGEFVRIVFSRSLEEDRFVVPDDFYVSESLSKNLGIRNFKIPAGKYKVDRSKFKNGEVQVPIK